MAKEQSVFGTSRELGPHASRRGLLQAGLAIGTLALGQRAALGQSGGAQYQNDMLLELDQHRLNVIAYDGIQLGSLQEMKQLLIAPGQRADVLVQAGGAGTYELNAMPFDLLHPMSTGPLARVVVAGEPLAMKLPTALPKPPLEAIRDGEITGRRTLVLSTIGDPPE